MEPQWNALGAQGDQGPNDVAATAAIYPRSRNDPPCDRSVIRVRGDADAIAIANR